MQQTHDTVLTGTEKETGNLVFFKSYHYETEKEQAQADLKEVQDAGHVWWIGRADHMVNLVSKWNQLSEEISNIYSDPDEDNEDEDWKSPKEQIELSGKLVSETFGCR